MSRIFFIAIARSADPSAHTMEELYARIGRNTGNLLFTNAVWQQVAWAEAGSGYFFEPDQINERFDAVVIPAANWLYEKFDFSELADRISMLRLPVVLIGIGAQAGNDYAVPKLPKGTVRFLRAVSERSMLIGTRGQFSSEVLDSYGIRNHMPIGCPSLFLRNPHGAFIEKRDPQRVMVGGTRYGVPRPQLGPLDGSQRALYALAAAAGFDVNYQSERPELDFLFGSHTKDAEPAELPSALVSYYGLASATGLEAFLRAHGRCYLDVDQWIAAMRGYDLYIGSRIHGAIASLLAGTPALLMSHDSRTAELADFAAIPHVDIRQAASIDANWISDMYAQLDFGRFLQRLGENFSRFVEFLEVNGLPHRTQNLPKAS